MPTAPKTSSAATTVLQETAQAPLNPVKILGNADGINIYQTIFQLSKPKFLPISIKVLLTVAKPLIIFKVKIHIAPKDVMNRIGLSPNPNHNNAKGNRLTEGIGINIEVKISTIVLIDFDIEANPPMIKLITVLIKMEIRSRRRVAQAASNIYI